ncbi:hypothetical protein SAMN05216474_0061 [Lishizhenia tianjinensis]|uniref:CAAX prenyl protease 2/Lysostaphin resistance protein A-like domain-containing protein n=1 Tax=Lishizhenia tianjinensis TaxID=477690 RepID=A0A1I6XC75_9FLAO|nr:type II CAAX endopeptidase family protein [Lishizhenia tianjinensis]SFT35424.1 hypothetical protein SAMN05216474_0061 [Lishizhenia tianjinensis]
MLGILVILVLSWFLNYLYNKGNFNFMGLSPLVKRIIQWTLGFLVSAILCGVLLLLEAYLKGASWQLSTSFSSTSFFHSVLWDFKSVFTEELLFRGVLLYILIHKIGENKAVLLSALAFGVYHWFSFGVFGNVMAMLVVLVSTGLMGYAWAWSFSKTKSMFLPIGLHFGWNFMYNTIFSKGPLGQVTLALTNAQDLEDWTSLLYFLISVIMIPLLVMIFVKYGIKKAKA